MGRQRKLTPAQERYIRRACRIRRELTNKVLMRRFGITDNTIAAICRRAA